MPRLTPSAAPRPLRLALYAMASGVLLWLCLAPTDALPEEHLWDKAEHALAWTVLAGAGLILSPGRPRAVATYAFLFGAGVEVLQATLPFGRDGDWRDLIADALGVAAALGGWWLTRRLARAR